MPSCIPGSKRNLPPFSNSVHPLQKRFQKGDDGKIGTHFQRQSSSIECILPCACCSFWIIWRAIIVTIWCVGAMNVALGFYTRLVQAHGSTWRNRSSELSYDEQWRDTISMMEKSS